MHLRRNCLPQLLHGLFLIDIGGAVNLASLLVLLWVHLPDEWVCCHASLPLSPKINHVLLQCHLVLPLRVEALRDRLLLLLRAKIPEGQVSGMARLLLARQEAEEMLRN